jgi:hypothetical protein
MRFPRAGLGAPLAVTVEQAVYSLTTVRQVVGIVAAIASFAIFSLAVATACFNARLARRRAIEACFQAAGARATVPTERIAIVAGFLLLHFGVSAN